MSQRIASGQALGLPVPEAESTESAYARLKELSYDELCQHFRQEVKDFFVNELGRPEILNRIGEENILVFNFLKDEKTKTEIVEKQINELSASLLEEYRVTLRVTPAFVLLLKVHPSGFEQNGARGVKTLLGKYVMDPLAEQYFEDRTGRENKVFKVDYRVKEPRIREGPFDRSKLKYKWEDH